MAAPREYYYNEQIRNHLKQFMAVFAGLQVMVGKNANNNDPEAHLVSVPVVNASKDRVVAALKSGFTQNKPLRLPLMSARFGTFDMAPDLRKGTGTTRRSTTMPTGGLFPDDIKVVEQRMPTPYWGMFELAIWGSNQDQHSQIVEQMLCLFDPTLQLQTSDELFDWTKLSSLELTNVNFDENVPSGSDRRIVQSTLSFKAPMFLSIPTDVHKRYVADILVRIGVTNLATTGSYEIIQELEDNGFEYETWFNLDDITGIT